MDRKNLYAPPSSIPDLRSGPRTQRVKIESPPPKSLAEKVTISLTSGAIMAVCVAISQRVFGQMWIGVVLGTLLSTKFLHSRFERPLPKTASDTNESQANAKAANDCGKVQQQQRKDFGSLHSSPSAPVPRTSRSCMGPGGDPRNFAYHSKGAGECDTTSYGFSPSGYGEHGVGELQKRRSI